MKIIAPTIVALCLMTVSSFAQTREETLQRVSAAIAKINETMPSQQEYATAKTGYIEDKVNEALKMVLDLRDSLSGNPYVRVSSVSVGLPIGVSVELSFPESDK